MKKLFTLLGALLAVLCLCRPVMGRTIIDMRGVAAEVADNPQRIATIDDGFIEGVLTHLGEIHRVKAIGSWSMKRDYSYSFESVSGEKYTMQGLSTMRFLHPWLNELPCINSPQGNIISYETLAAAAPDVVLLRAGDTPLGTNKEKLQKCISIIESLGLPLIVLFSPSCFENGSLHSMRTEAGIIGELFHKRRQAEALADYLSGLEEMIQKRTRQVPESRRPSILLLGLRPDIRKKGGAGTVHGTDTAESYITENVVHARNAYRGKGYGIPISTEQVYALDPDIILLPTANGYHPARELLEAPYYAQMQELRAVKERRVYALPWSPMNASRRTEYPLDMLIAAKAAYPELFYDINIYEFTLEFYRHVYGVNEEQAKGLRSTQLLDWMKEKGF